MSAAAEPGRTLLEALRFAAAGAPVFPCVPGAKHPLTEHGYLDATTDRSTIQRWFGERWPTANLAVPTGAPGYDVLDVDVRGDANGWDAFYQARQAGLLAGWTHAVSTPSGGLHLYFPGTEQRSASVPSRHVDLRAAGGYVLVPPSVIDRGGTLAGYTVTTRNDRPPRRLDWPAVRALLTPASPAPSQPSSASAAARSDAIADWLARWITRQGEGNRNHGLFWAACRAAERGVTDTRPLVQAAISVGLTEREAATTIVSAYRRSARHHAGGVPGRPPPATGRHTALAR